MKIDLTKPFRVETKDDGREVLTVTIEKPRPGTAMEWLVRGANGHRPVHGPSGGHHDRDDGDLRDGGGAPGDLPRRRIGRGGGASPPCIALASAGLAC
jgi:hypothetical protein